MIGIFDSGVGGLTVVKALLAERPNAAFVYLGDTARTPYGNKSAETVRQYARQDAQYLLDHGATSIVIACNSASALATETLRDAFPHVPIFSVIEPAIRAAVALHPKRVAVIGTRATIGSGIYQSELEQRLPKAKIFSTACPLFVSLVEEGMLEQQITKLVAKHYLSSMRTQNLDTMILGCTHYPLMRGVIGRAVGKGTRLIDPAEAVVRELLQNVQPQDGPQTFALTDLTPHTVAIASQWLHRPVHFELATLVH